MKSILNSLKSNDKSRFQKTQRRYVFKTRTVKPAKSIRPAELNVMNQAISDYFAVRNSGKKVQKQMYEDLLLMLLDARRIKKSVEIFGHAETAGCRLSQAVYQKIFDVFVSGHVQMAFEIYNKKEYFEIPSDDRAENKLIKNLIRFHFNEEAKILFYKEERSTQDYSKFIENLIGGRFIDDAVDALKRMQENNRKLTLADFHRVAVSLSSVGRVEESLSIIRNSGRLREDTYYPHFVKGLCNSKQTEGALSFFSEMIDSPNPPKIPYYHHVLQHLSSAGKTTEIMALIKSMEEGPVKPDIWAYTSVISSLIQEGKPDQAITMYLNLIDQGHPVDEEMFLKIKSLSEHPESITPLTALQN